MMSNSPWTEQANNIQENTEGFMDRIYINDLEIYAYHGVFSEEKAVGQKFLISLELSLCLREAGNEDDLSKTVDYAEVCLEAEKVFTGNKYNLIEKCAEELARHILLKFTLVEEVKILVKKPDAPIGRKVGCVAVELERSRHKAYISLGSNMGDREDNLKSALRIINDDITVVTKVSKFYETKPVGYNDQANFLNCAAEIRTLLTPGELIRFLLKIENTLKRVREIQWGPRTIDLDVLLYDNEITSCEEIIIPHPRMHERLFVLVPLCDIAPHVMHPIINERIIDLKEKVSKTQSLL